MPTTKVKGFNPSSQMRRQSPFGMQITCQRILSTVFRRLSRNEAFDHRILWAILPRLLVLPHLEAP